jgi:hypothetical protein
MMAISKGQIKKIKVMQREAGLDDDLYREMLWGVARVKSCKDLKGPKVQLVIKHLERCLGQGPGVRGQGSGKTKNQKLKTKNQPLRATEAQLLAIRRLWGRVSRAAQEWGPESRQAHEALNKFLWGRFKVAAPEWLTLPQAQRVIEAIKMNDSEAVASYLKSLSSGGQESQKERDCLARIALWEGLAGFCEEMGKNDQFYCGNLNLDLTVGLCNAARREARRRVLTWPDGLGWLAVCVECPVRATEAKPPLPRPMSTAEFEAKVGWPGRDPAVMMSSFSDPGGAPALKRPKTRRPKRTAGGDARPTYDPETMTRAVARDLGLI